MSEEIKNQTEEQAVEAEETQEPVKETKKEKKQNAKLEEKIAQLEEEAAKQDDRYKRILAEYDNFRKRTQKEKESTYQDAQMATVAAFLPVLDNLERGAAQENADEGVKMMHKQALEILEKLHVKACGQVGESFDPNFHNAVMHIEDENLGENVISAVFQKGYKIGDKVIRFAMVQVAN